MPGDSPVLWVPRSPQTHYLRAPAGARRACPPISMAGGGAILSLRDPKQAAPTRPRPLTPRDADRDLRPARHSSLPKPRDTRHSFQLLLTSNSLRAITYATVCIYSFQKTLSPHPATLTRYPLANSLPCHSYEYMGGRGGTPRVHISLILKHLAFSPHQSLLANHESLSSNSLSAITYRDRASKPLCAFTYEISFPQVLSRHHIPFSPQPKPLCAITYENMGYRGSASSHFLFSIFYFRLHSRSERPIRAGGFR